MTEPLCWCGGQSLKPFSEFYEQCTNCGGLVCKNLPSEDFFSVNDDASAFYGRNYWLSHVSRDYSQPNICDRARSDLSERCIHWLKTLTKYVLPRAKCLELGCSHGGFVAMMRWAGYDAVGLELSPWITDFIKQTFDVPVLSGPIEKQDLPDESFDVIILMDVLEHLRDPVKTMGHCSKLLKDNGCFLIQTPCFGGGHVSYHELVEAGDLFVKTELKESEHLFLFTRDSVTQLMKKIGCPYVTFEPAIFPADMFFLAGKVEYVPYSISNVENSLNSTVSGRLIQALFDLYGKFDEKRLRVEELIRQIEILSLDYKKRGQALDRIPALTKQIEDLSVDYEKRGDVINWQLQRIHELTRQIETLGADYEKRGDVISQQLQRIHELTNEPPAYKPANHKRFLPILTRIMEKVRKRIEAQRVKAHRKGSKCE